jgi:hypothetical protein
VHEVTSAVDHVPAWIAEALDGLSVGQAPQQTLVKLRSRTVCINAVAAPDAEAAWPWFSAAAADRATAVGEHLAPVVTSGRLDDKLYIAYDVTGATTLAAHRERSGGSGAEIARLLGSLARGLDGAVRAGLSPTEVTPASVFVHPKRGALLADLGLVRQALGNPPPKLDTGAAWVAPEVLLGEEAGARAAVYSFGALTYYLLTGSAPFAGGPDDVLAADPPSVTAARPDLPDALDLVVSAAMARDPYRRYRSVSEARTLADVVLLDSLAAERAAEPAPRRPPPPPRKAPVAPRTALTALVLALVVAIGVLAGLLLAGLGDTEPAKPVRVSVGDLALQVPAGWTSAGAGDGGLQASPEGDPASGLALEPVASPIAPGEQATPIRLGRVEAWRDSDSGAAGARRSVRYVIPTSTGKLVATCRASGEAAPGTLELCERSLSTLRLPAAVSLPLADVVAQQRRWQATVADLSSQRTRARRRLAEADLPAGQRLAAESLARVHTRFAERFGAQPGGEDVAAAGRRAAAAYEGMAAAAGSDRRARWQAAVGRVRRAEAALERALASA